MTVTTSVLDGIVGLPHTGSMGNLLGCSPPASTTKPGCSAGAGRAQHRIAVASLTLALLVGGCTSPSQTDGANPPPTGAPAASTSSGTPRPPTTEPSKSVSATDFTELEDRYDARLGVFALDTGSGQTVQHRDDERFAYASTIKALAAAAVLEKTSSRELDQVLRYDQSDLVPYSPITEKHVDEGMTLRAVCDAALRYSDNTAGNLLFRELGGPAALDRQLEAIGDRTTRVVRNEPSLNEATPDDRRDTSTPAALGADLRRYVLGDVLTSADRRLLTHWLRRNTTGDSLVRAGVPDGWTVGDKSGAGGFGTRNDIAVVWPPDKAPIVLTVMSSRDTPDAEYDDALIADATRAALRQLNR